MEHLGKKKCFYKIAKSGKQNFFFSKLIEIFCHDKKQIRFRICIAFDSVLYLNVASHFNADPDSDPGPDSSPGFAIALKVEFVYIFSLCFFGNFFYFFF
jgi:hypothetical protein